jgi:uncharacterized protein YegL
MSKLSEFTLSSARPLPVILLADVSGSMSVNGKIDVLNASVSEMIRDFGEEDSARAEIHTCVITFGGEVKIHQPMAPAEDMTWTTMSAKGGTPMGAAFSMARELIENKETISGRAYRPTIILVSDGKPTDDWEVPLAELIGSERASKAFRFAMGIGDDAEVDTLQKFADQTAHIFTAGEAGGDIRKFFKWVTMSVSTRTRSVNPDQPEEFDIFDVEDEFDDDF